MSDDRNETLSHSVESARPDVEMEREEERLDDDFDIATKREQDHAAAQAARQHESELQDPSLVDGS